MTTYLLRTSSGALIMSFDTLEAAKQAKANRQGNYSRPLVIVAQRVTEARVA